MPLSPVPTPFDDRIGRLKQRLEKKKGPNPDLKAKLQKVKGKAYSYGQENYTAPTPYSGAYDSTVAGLTNEFNQSQSEIAGQTLATEQQYGFGGDTSNPFSQARLLERNRLQQQNRTQNSYAGAGQLYSGALSNAKGADQFNAAQSLDTSQRDYMGKLAELRDQGVRNQNTLTSGRNDAYSQRIEDALNQAPDPSEAPKPPKSTKSNKSNKNKDKPKKGKRN